MPERFPVKLKSVHLEKAEKLGIKPEDITESFILGSGHGGQKINKTANCVQLKHLPTDTIINCQKFREQGLNRVEAYKLLIDSLEEKIDWNNSKKAKRINKLKKQKARRTRRRKSKEDSDDTNEPSA